MKLPKGTEFPKFEDEYMLFGMLFVLGNKLQTLGDSFYEEITSKQWFVLLMMNVFGNDYPTLNELSDAMGSSHQNVKQLVIKLETKGYVELYTDEKDRRKIRIRKTTKYDDLDMKYKKKQQEFMTMLFANLDKQEIKTAMKVLMQFEDNLEAMR